MNNKHASAFLGVGLGMIAVPALAPLWVTSGGAIFPETRALWLLVMGCLNGAIGGAWLLRSASMEVVAPRVAGWLKLRGAAQQAGQARGNAGLRERGTSRAVA